MSITLNEIDELYPWKAHYARHQRFMLTCLERVRGNAPEFALDGIALLRKWVDGHASVNELTLCERECRRYLSPIPLDRPEVHPRRCVVRGLLCAIAVEPTDDDTLTTLEFFLTWMARAGLSEAEEAQNLAEAYGPR